MNFAIEVNNLTKTYESWRKEAGFLGTVKSLFKREKISVPAVKDISFKVKEGELLGFIGPNGAGKTTTLKMLSGILWPSSGQAKVLGCVPWKRQRVFQRQLGIVLGQKNQLIWDLPARDTFLLNKDIYEISDKDFEKRVKELGDVLDASHLFEMPVRKLSLGERMKCELVNALMHNPKVLFLDEPTIGLDVISQKAIRVFLKQWNKRQGTTMILTSHSMADVEELCERVIVIHSGQIRYDGAFASLVQKVADHKEVTVTFEEPVSREVIKGFGKVASYSSLRCVLEIPRPKVREVAAEILAKLPVSDLLIEEVPIDEVVRKIFLEK